MNTPQRIVVRVALLAAVWIAYNVMVGLVPSGQGDANIGVGLIGFGIVVLVAGIGGVLDGRRLPFSSAALVWIVTAVAFSAVAAAFFAAGERGLDAPDLAADLLGLSVFVTVLVAVPAIVGGALGSAIRQPHSPQPERR